LTIRGFFVGGPPLDLHQQLSDEFSKVQAWLIKNTTSLGESHSLSRRTLDIHRAT